MNTTKRPRYRPDEVKTILDAYQHIFGTINGQLRDYWDLDRKRPWGCLTTNFNVATFDKYEEATDLVEGIKIADQKERGLAIKEVTQKTGVGLSIGLCPWTDHGLLQTYEQNKHKGRLTIILGHDWYPIVPDKEHPVDAPLFCDQGLHTTGKYRYAVPPAIINRSELLLFLNFNPDFREPGKQVIGRFKSEIYPRCTKGFNALIETVSRNFKVQVISWGAPVWESLRGQVNNTEKALGLLENAKQRPGHRLELRCGALTIDYLPLAHPCYATNFNKAHHKHHVSEGYKNMGLAE